MATHSKAAAATLQSTTVAAPVATPTPSAPGSAATAPDTDNGQDQTGADPAGSAAAGTEAEKAGAESEAAGDGPGGFADVTANGQPDTNATTEQQGEH